MAGIGLRKPYYAHYIYDPVTGQVTYTGGGIMAKAVEFTASIEDGGDNNLYADDGIAESDRSFAGGEMSITTDDLTQEASTAVLGVRRNEVTLPSGDVVTELVYDESAEAPNLGFGIIIPKRRGGKAYYRALVMNKVMFSVPEESAKTKGDKVEWQTPKITGTIMRSDGEGHPWKREATLESEAAAEAYIKHCLNIVDESLGSLTVTSAPGAATGDTKLTVTPTKEVGNSYKTKTGANLTLPTNNQICASGYANWDGLADITATTGQKIMVVEVDGENRAKKAGTATVAAKA